GGAAAGGGRAGLREGRHARVRVAEGEERRGGRGAESPGEVGARTAEGGAKRRNDRTTDKLPIGGQKAGGERTVVDELPPSRSRQRLRPELIRAFEATGYAALVLMGLPKPRGEDADKIMTTLEGDLVGDDVLVRVSDEKI